MSDNQSDNSAEWSGWFPKPRNLQEVFKERVDTPPNEFVKNSMGGIKGDGAKPRPTLLLKSCNKAVQSIIDVLEYGARKYSADNWKKVEHARYLDAAFRHMMAYTSGEVNDTESDKHHLAHTICCLLFMLQMDLDKESAVYAKDAKEN